jgi:hypothetical protein
MMDGFFATLEARDPSLGRMRSYHLEAGIDLFGAWLVDVVYGRIGASYHFCELIDSNDWCPSPFEQVLSG